MSYDDGNYDWEEHTLEENAEFIRRALADDKLGDLGVESDIWQSASDELNSLDIRFEDKDPRRALQICERFLLPGITTNEFDDLFDRCIRAIGECGQWLAEPENKAEVYAIARRLRDCFYLCTANDGQKPWQNGRPSPFTYLCVGIEVFENTPSKLCLLWENSRGHSFVTYGRLDEVLAPIDRRALRDRFGFEIAAMRHPELINQFTGAIEAMDHLDLERARHWDEKDRTRFQAYLADERHNGCGYTDCPHIYTWVFEQLVVRYGALFPELKLHPLPWRQCKAVTWLPRAAQDPFDVSRNSLPALIAYMEQRFDQRVTERQNQRLITTLLASDPRVGGASPMRVLTPGTTPLSDWNVMRRIIEYGDFQPQRLREADARDPAAARRRKYEKQKQKKARQQQRRAADAIEWQTQPESKRPSA